MSYENDYVDSESILTGDVFYRERMALRPDSLVTVRLQDVSEAQAPRLLGDQIIRIRRQQVPVSFAIAYDPAHIERDQRIVVTAEIEGPQGEILFRSRAPIPVITGDNPSSDVQVMVVRADPDQDTAGPAVVSGTAAYRERIALHPASRFTIQLQDTSRMDVAAIILGEESYQIDNRSVPLPFAIPYDPETIDPRFTYSIAARITDPEGKLLFINDTVTPVITRGNPTSDIVVELVAVQR